MKKVKILIGSIIMAAALLVTSCGSSGAGTGSGSGDQGKSGGGKKDVFDIEDGVICGLTDSGKKEKEIVIPAGCTEFVGGLYEGASFTTVSFESDDDVKIKLAFAGSEKLENITLPKNLTSFDPMVFQKCTALKSIAIPDGITELPIASFNGCTNLKTVTLSSSLTKIGSDCFADCSSLEDISFPSTLKTIGREAFDGCSSLKSVELPEGLTAIDDSVFSYCESLTTVKLPASLKEIGMNTFYKAGVTDIYVPAGMELTSYDSTSFFNPHSDGAIKVHVAQGSWADQNFDDVFPDAEKVFD